MRRPWWLSFPGPDADPRETLEWVRKAEILTGIAGIGFGLALLNEGWWAWLVIALGVMGVSPWPGARTILRMAERDPNVLIHDPARRRARGRRVVVALVPFYLVAGGVIGYVADGWPAAIFVGTFMGLTAAGSAWWYIRRGKSRG